MYARWLREILYRIAIGITILLTVGAILVTSPFVQRILLATSPVFGLSVEQRWQATQILLNYFGTGNSTLLSSYPPDEQAHLTEVATIFRITGLLLLATAIIALGLGIGIAKQEGLSMLKNKTRQAFKAAAILCLGLFLVGLLIFPILFILFHRLLFVAAPWAFDPASSLLVNLYPEAYFRNAAAAILLLTATISGLAFWWLGKK